MPYVSCYEIKGQKTNLKLETLCKFYNQYAADEYIEELKSKPHPGYITFWWKPYMVKSSVRTWDLQRQREKTGGPVDIYSRVDI